MQTGNKILLSKQGAHTNPLEPPGYGPDTVGVFV